MRFNKEVEYALIGLTAMTGTDGLISARDLADEYSVPHGLLAKILQRLASAGVLESVQGAHGGYRLARSKDEITLGDIIDSVQGRKHVARCLDDEACSQIEVCNIKDSIESVQSMWDQLISTMTLGEFAERRTASNVS